MGSSSLARRQTGAERPRSYPRAALRLWLVLFALMSPLLATITHAQVTTQKTKKQPIAESDRTDKALPRPAAPKACVQYTLTVDGKTGKVKMKATFSNKENVAKSFVFCQMIGISADQALVPTWNLKYDSVAKKIHCEAAAANTRTFTKSVHFGCKKVDLQASGEVEVDYGEQQSDDYIGKKAADFEVTYADFVELPAGATFDETSCNACRGANRNIFLEVDPPKLAGDWYLPKLPFTDPFIAYQTIDSTTYASEPEYRGLALDLGVPSNFPVEVPQLPHNFTTPAPSLYAVTLNLMDIYTMSAETTEVFPAQLTLYQTGNLSGVSFDTYPPPGEVFEIVGGYGAEGDVYIRTNGFGQEGDTANVLISVHMPDQPDSLGPLYFSERGFFVNDTRPPLGLGSSVTRTAIDSVHVQVTAIDSTTSPLAATFWYSLDGGVTWADHELAPDSDLLLDVPIRSFTGSVGGVPDTAPMKYFFMVQDEVFNMLFYGVGESLTAVPGPDDQGASELDIFGVAPNPINLARTTRLVLTGRFPGEGDVEIRLISPQGREVSQWRAKTALGQRTLDLNLARQDLVSGHYLLRIVSGVREFTERVVIIR